MPYLLAAVCFILSLQGLSHIKTARYGNLIGISGMVIAIVSTLFLPGIHQYGMILLTIISGGMVGLIIAKKIPMMALPQLIAAFHSLVGLAAVFVAGSALYAPQVFHIGILGNIKFSNMVELSLGTIIGAITFSGSIIAFLKLQGLMSGKSILLKNRHFINIALASLMLFLMVVFINTQSQILFFVINAIAMLLGVLLIVPIGGADMPVIVSMLNSYSGWAASGIGFSINNTLLVITGALVGSSGAILSYIMCKGMNRSLFNVLIGGFGEDSKPKEMQTIESQTDSIAEPKTITPKDSAQILKDAKSVIIVPGYGMAVSQAQHVLSKITEFLKDKKINVRYAIHPVAGRMPGHMNVLLAEANVDYDDVLELDEINQDFKETDVTIVIGANDITNPAAKKDETSPIYGMPILDVEASKKVLFIKRSLNSGYAGIDNELFFYDNVQMVLGDAKKVCEEIYQNLEEA